jgi:hypothetical protein
MLSIANSFYALTMQLCQHTIHGGEVGPVALTHARRAFITVVAGQDFHVILGLVLLGLHQPGEVEPSGVLQELRAVDLLHDLLPIPALGQLLQGQLDGGTQAVG